MMIRIQSFNLNNLFGLLFLLLCVNTNGFAAVGDEALKLSEIGTAYHELKSYKEALKFYEDALKKDTSGNDKSSFAITRDYKNLGDVWFALENFNKASEFYEKALAGAIKMYGRASPVVKTIRKNISGSWQALRCGPDKRQDRRQGLPGKLRGEPLQRAVVPCEEERCGEGRR